MDSVQTEMYEPRVAKAVLRVSLDYTVAATANSLGHFQVSFFVPSSHTRCASPTLDFALPNYFLICVIKNDLR